MNFIKRYKKLLLCLIIGIVLGFSGAANASVPKDDFNSLLAKKSSVEEKISNVDILIVNENKSIEILKQQKLDKEESINLAKKEAEEKAKAEAEEIAKQELAKAEQKKSTVNTYSSESSFGNGEGSESKTKVEGMVWLSATGSKYHNKNNCGRMNPNKARQIERSQAEAQGFDACKKCY